MINQRSFIFWYFLVAVKVAQCSITGTTPRAITGRFGSVPRAVASVLVLGSRSLPLAVLIRPPLPYAQSQTDLDFDFPPECRLLDKRKHVDYCPATLRFL
jgi:hypothetical protein